MSRPLLQSPSVGAVLLGALAFALLLIAYPGPPVTDDGVRDQLYVRDCLELGKCPTIGAPTSVQGIHQGAEWIDLLAGVRLAGGSVVQERLVVLGLNALAVAVLFLVVARWLGIGSGLASALMVLATLLRDGTLGQLVNPNGAVLPDLLCAACLLLLAATNRSRWLWAAAFFAGIAVNMHVAAAALVPSIFIIAVLISPRPWLESFVAVLILSATALSTSWDAWYLNTRHLEQHAPWRLIAIGSIAVLMGAGALRRHVRALSMPGRAAIVGVLLVLPFAAGALVLTRFLHHSFGLTYLYPVLAPAVVLAVGGVHRITSRREWITGGAGAVAAVLMVTTASTRPFERLHNPQAALPWTFADVPAFAGWMTAHGWSWDDALLRVQGQNCREFLIGLGTTMPRSGEVSHAPDRAIQFQIDGAGRAGDTAIPLASGRTAFLGETRSWLRPERLHACRYPVDGPPTCEQELPQTAAEKADSARFLFSSRGFPGFPVFDEPGRYTARYIVSVVPEAPGRRTIELVGVAPTCDWKIESVVGLTAEEQLPATRVTIRSVGTPGHLVLSRPVGTSDCPAPTMTSEYPPCFVEGPVLPLEGR